jgi:outer membrane protein
MGRIAQLAGVIAFTTLSANASHAADDLYGILELALDNDPTLRQAEANYRANRENMIQSRANLLPNLNATGNTARLTSGPTDEISAVNPFTGQLQVQQAHSFRPGINNHGWGLNLNQSLVNLAQWYGFQSARAADKAAAVNLAAQEQDPISMCCAQSIYWILTCKKRRLPHARSSKRSSAKRLAWFR